MLTPSILIIADEEDGRRAVAMWFAVAVRRILGCAGLGLGAGAGDKPLWRQHQLRRSAGGWRNYRARRGHRDSWSRSCAAKGAGTRNNQADTSHYTHALGSHSGSAVLFPGL